MLRAGTPPAEVGALARALGGRLEPELLFGIGGGTGFGRFNYGPAVTLVTRITTGENEREAFLALICQRLGIPHRLQVASSEAALLRRLTGALEAGLTPVLWVSGESLPWPSFPKSQHAVAVVSIEGEQAQVDDGEQRRLPVATLLAASRTPAAPHRTLIVEGPPQGKLEAAIRAGLAAHLEQMWEGWGPRSVRSRFGLAGLTGWTRTVAEDNAMGADLGAQILMRGGGPAMRLAHARFLELAGRAPTAGAAQRAAAAWSALGQSLLVGTAGTAEVAAVRDAEQASLETIERAFQLSV
ncbi:MAG TPA: BtrH N-terminal domain-containing protein [Candidatus Dormibacteraeota bacterium]